MALTMPQFLRKLRVGVRDTYKKKQMKALGELAIDLIVERTRQGFGVSRTGAKQKPLKSLSPPYIDHRKANRSKLDSTTSPHRSNLTFTGRMLRSMRVKKVSNRLVSWGPNKRRRKGGLTNEKIGELVAENGRPFNFLSRKDIKKMVKLADKILQRSMRRV